MAQANSQDWLQASKWEDEIRDLLLRRVDPEENRRLQEASFVKRRLTPWSDLLTAYWASTEQRYGALDRSTPGCNENVDADNLDGWNLPSDHDTEAFKRRRGFPHFMRLRIGIEFWGFLSLPLEIRRLVYEDLLLLGKIFMPVKCEEVHGIEFREPLDQLLDRRGEPYYRYRDYENFRVRSSTDSADRRLGMLMQEQTTKILKGNFTVGLISGVCRTVQHEAMAVFYGQNRFIFPFGETVFDNAGQHLDHQLQVCWVPMLRDISLSFDSRYMEETAPDLRQRLIQSVTTVPRSSEEQPQQASHDKAAHASNVHGAVIYTVTALTKLRRLQLDFEECFCVFGCCRQVMALCDLLHNLTIEPPELIEVLGFKDDAEKNIIKKKLTTLNGLTDENRVSFSGLSTMQKMDLYALDALLV